jgi:hypothetical protein
MLRRLIAGRKRRIIACAIPLGTVAAVTFAAWLVDGVGNGTGKAGRLQALVVTAAAEPTNDADKCFPGTTCPAFVTIHNPNTALRIRSVVQAGDPAGLNHTCPNNENGVVAVPQTGLDIPLPPGTADYRIPGVFQMGAGAADGCQDRSFFFPLRITAATP